MIALIYDEECVFQGTVPCDDTEAVAALMGKLPSSWSNELRNGKPWREQASRTPQAPTDGSLAMGHGLRKRGQT